MKNKVPNFYRWIVGTEYGWCGEGNEQWYYTIALVINIMASWWLMPQYALLFTIAAVIHYATVFVYGYFGLEGIESVWCSVAYFAIHLALFIICCCTHFGWTIVTTLTVVVAFLIAPNACGDVILLPEFISDDDDSDESIPILVIHTIWFLAFFVMAMLLPISIWFRLAIVVACISIISAKQ